MSSSSTFVSGVSDDLLDKLYSIPTLTGAAAGLPGQTHESSQAVLEALLHDFKRHSPFLNHLKFHNHASHHILAIYALGASPELIKDVYYKRHLPKLLSTHVSPGLIVEENFVEHLGDERFYDAYLAFFIEYLQDHTPSEALEHFVFSPAYNFRSANGRDSKEKVQPQFLNRLLAGVIHPLVHLAYGLEFGILGQVAEGLAQAAVHDTDQTELIPPSYFTKLEMDTSNAVIMHRLEIAGSDTSASAPEKRPTFEFHRRIRDDPAFAVEFPCSPLLHYAAVVKSAGGAIRDLVQEWTEEWLAGVGTRGGADAESRLRGMVEEVVWGNVIWYGISGWASRGAVCGREINADFFLVHLVTSAIFLPQIILQDVSSLSSSAPGLSFASRLLLLQTYLSVSAALYITRGRHALPIAEFYEATDSAQLSLSAGASSGWTRVIQSAVRFPEEHAPKIARALVDFDARWGTRAPGYFAACATVDEEEVRMAAATELEGIEILDGTLFARVAGLTFDRLGWVDEGEKAGQWDWDGYPMLDLYATIKGGAPSGY